MGRSMLKKLAAKIGMKPLNWSTGGIIGVSLGVTVSIFGLSAGMFFAVKFRAEISGAMMFPILRRLPPFILNFAGGGGNLLGGSNSLLQGSNDTMYSATSGDQMVSVDSGLGSSPV